ncbi:hypothetical protein J3R30DRAFT_3506442 [Lentinula aciculospora]|uniref:ZW10 C-terminal helical domain-containing protein n=1 Tax=Lentinula aciculospora TaxID=153920 RepID=A0A9W9A5N6_9AGAR|nr:hypothetical protein J3R30DRAFT_3506442 [Lentinula aciculospora]
MAFPIPSHLPRRAMPQDATSKILSTMDEATHKSLTASLAKSWLEELDATIQSTKERIHDRIHADLPEFERQLQTSKSVQTRLRTLTVEVDSLNHSLHDPESGLVPSLIKTLTAHLSLAQRATNARIKNEVLTHLVQFRDEFSSLETLVQNGDLPEAVESCTRMEQLLKDAPIALAQSDVYLDLKRKFSAAKARTEEQLSDAYSRCVLVGPHQLTIAQSVQVRQSERLLALSEILSSLSLTTLDHHLNTLRRDITTHYIDILLTQPTSVVEEDFMINFFPSPPNDEVIGRRIDNLFRTSQFLFTHFFIYLPKTKRFSFLQSLCKPVISSVLNNLLIPNLPTSFARLPTFLELVKHAVSFEETCIIGLLGNDSSDRPIKAWADRVGGHYERQRRVHILENCRARILEHDNFSDTFHIEVEVARAVAEPEVVPVQEEALGEARGLDEDDLATKIDDDGWGFDEDAGSAKKGEDGWGFDDDPNALDRVDDGWGFDDTAESTDLAVDESSSENVPETNGHEPKPELQSEDAWGLEDDAGVEAPAATDDETNWDDPWGESNSAPLSASAHPARPPPAPSIKSPPKVATRLEKLANKGKKGLNGNSPMNSPSMSTQFSPNISSSSPAVSSPSFNIKPTQSTSPTQPSLLTFPSTASKLVEKRPPDLSFSAPKESYLVSTRMKAIVVLVKETLRECREFIDSQLLSAHESISAPGTTLYQTAVSILDLYRALYPVAFSGILQSLEGPMRFSNNCLYLSTEVEIIGKEFRGLNVETVKGRLGECGHALKLLSESWYGDAIERQRQLVNHVLTEGTQGLTSTGDQDRYDECENAINRTLQEIRRVSHKWKGLLTKNKYYTALGSVTDAALSRVLQDVLALGDIPELESHRLSELCRILLALEGLFSDDPEKPSFVVAYVPSWLKFSYLSELLEASLADITYLFEVGALVDFEIEELARLVRALFADTPLRTSTISTILSGHPTPR